MMALLCVTSQTELISGMEGPEHCSPFTAVHNTVPSTCMWLSLGLHTAA